MNMRRVKLLDLEAGYAVTAIMLNKRLYYLAASEAEGGKCVLINSHTKATYPLEGLCGGVMALVGIPERPGAFLAIQKFYPIFRSEQAEIVYVQMIPQEDGTIRCHIQTVCKLPYVHRIALVGEPGRRKIIAATLCKEKKDIQDWSSAGAVYELPLPEPGLDGEVSPTPVLLGIHQNHGMFAYRAGREDIVLVSGAEGIFSLTLAQEDSIWVVRKLLCEPTSDIWLYDLDHDGIDELVTIQPFHGDCLRIYHQNGRQWEPMQEFDLSFGHAIWAGRICDKTCLLSASRGGAKELILYEALYEEGKCSFHRIAAMEGLGTAQISVCDTGDTVRVVTSDHGVNEVGELIFSHTLA